LCHWRSEGRYNCRSRERGRKNSPKFHVISFSIAEPQAPFAVFSEFADL
jgi:hypothetical protein